MCRALFFLLSICFVFPIFAMAERTQSLPPEGYITTRDGVKLYYEIAGKGSQTIVVSGGFLIREALDRLTEDHRIVFFDARGRGRSEAVTGDQVSLDHQVNDVEDLRQALGVEKIVLLGWSGMGKEMAVYAIRHPDRVERFIQAAPLPPWDGDFMQKMMERRMSRIDPEALSELREKREAGFWKDDPEGYCRAEDQVTRPSTFAHPENAVKQPDTCKYRNEWPVNLGPYFQTLLPTVEKVDLRELLPGLKIPRLVLYGAEDAIPLEGVQAWVEGLPNACLLVIPDSGHWPFVEGADLFFPAVEQFLKGKWPENAKGQACSNQA